MLKRSLLAATLCLFVFSGFAVAEMANPENGQILAKRCVCHKSNLNGEDAKDMVAKLNDYKAGKGAPKSMIRIAQKLSEQDIKDVSAYFSQQ